MGASGAFGAVPLFAGTLLITAIAMLVAVPAGLMSAIYLSEYAAPRVRSVVKPVLEILAGIPTVVYGYFAAITVAPLLREAGQAMGMDVESESALGAGLVMGVMIIPFVSSLSDDVINAVPQSLRDGSLALGATVSETIRRVVVPAALPGIVGGVLLGVSRAIGETMIVVMAAGLSAKLTANPLEAVTTVTVQIVTLLVGDQGVRQPEDPCRLRARAGAVHRDAVAQYRRPAGGPPLQGAVRMSGPTLPVTAPRSLPQARQRMEAGLARRYRRERRFRACGLVSVGFGVSFLGFLVFTIVGNGFSALRQAELRLELQFRPRDTRSRRRP
ncbi:MAG: phosphate ABC transporter permease subunit PstC [Rhodocyclaceae bacterium]|nr:phosphate ABC transporter permease subunit PstC [Rhodocyclaceae bacterium]